MLKFRVEMIVSLDSIESKKLAEELSGKSGTEISYEKISQFINSTVSENPGEIILDFSNCEEYGVQPPVIKGVESFTATYIPHLKCHECNNRFDKGYIIDNSDFHCCSIFCLDRYLDRRYPNAGRLLHFLFKDRTQWRWATEEAVAKDKSFMPTDAGTILIYNNKGNTQLLHVYPHDFSNDNYFSFIGSEHYTNFYITTFND